ncbi:hypothetical protein BKA69DRAFT_1105860 [Paraphysoderma sedebokerense]|nr:hypothetical protein BKA69DRAFT_1105860 [Paraphysoderma sedebokerense]
MVDGIKMMINILCFDFCLLIMCAVVAASYANLTKLTFAPGTLELFYRLYVAVNSYCYIHSIRFGICGISGTDGISNRVAVVSESGY